MKNKKIIDRDHIRAVKSMFGHVEGPYTVNKMSILDYAILIGIILAGGYFFIWLFLPWLEAIVFYLVFLFRFSFGV